MYILILLLCVNVLFVAADRAKHNGHCDSSKDLCVEQQEAFDFESKKLIFYDVNPPEGFNLRRDVYMRFAIFLTEAQKRGRQENWRLVLPPWHNMYHWKSETYHDPPKPWSMFFDVQRLAFYAKVLELHDIMHSAGKYGMKIDTLYVLQNFDDPFENGVFEEKWNVVGPCKYEGEFWGYRNITAKQIICIQFQGSISQLWNVIELNPDDRKVMFAHGEIPLHETYGTKTYWDCRKSMHFNVDLVVAAELYIVKKLNCYNTKCPNYLALHWRRQDFLRANRSTSVKSTAKQIHESVKNNSLDIQDVYVASDGTYDELEELQDALGLLGYTVHYYKPDIGKYSEGQIAIIEQIICSRSTYFIGTHESTFSYRIQEEREILGFNSDTTFNRLCPDFGECEKPSRWTIVH